MSAAVSRAVARLTGSPPGTPLAEIYDDLREAEAAAPEEAVARYALAGVVCEMIDYLDFVGEEVEKGFGLPRERERRRVLSALDRPAEAGPTEQVASVIDQWRSVEKLTREDLLAAVHDSRGRTRVRE